MVFNFLVSCANGKSNLSFPVSVEIDSDDVYAAVDELCLGLNCVSSKVTIYNGCLTGILLRRNKAAFFISNYAKDNK